MMNFFDIKPLDVQVPDKIFFHKKYKKFFQVKDIHDDWYFIGGLCDYFSDSQTNITRAKVSYEFMEDAEEVVTVDKYADFDGVGWIVKESE